MDDPAAVEDPQEDAPCGQPPERPHRRLPRCLAATNVTGRPRELRLNTGEAGLPEARWTDILDGSAFGGEGGSLAIAIEPYGVRWLRAGA